MNTAAKNEIEALGGDFTEHEWQWLLNNGPHGYDFTWSQTKQEPPGYVGIEHLEEIVKEKSENNPAFKGRVAKVINLALKSRNTNILIRAIQVGSVIGTEHELKTISALSTHENPSVINNAKAGSFYLKKRLKEIR